jgi:hypothetical protein
MDAGFSTSDEPARAATAEEEEEEEDAEVA